MSAEHKLKCWPNYFDAIERGEKNFEVRRDDRGFQKGDVLLLERYEPGKGYTTDGVGKWKKLRREITYVLTGGQFGIQPGFVVLGLKEDQP